LRDISDAVLIVAHRLRRRLAPLMLRLSSARRA
jgi:hypothetical protein